MIDNMNTTHASSSDLAHIRNEKIGFVLQDFSLINHRTALYNVKAPMLFNKTSFREMNGKAIKALTDLGIAEQAGKKVENMSGGQRQRVAIARAMVNDPPIILADEPTGNLDSATAAEIMDIFKELNKRGKTVVIVTHDEAVAAYCSRQIVLSDGKIVR
jgi:putative ABC transport system ATP-binding protein